jgi:hypothetical protein
MLTDSVVSSMQGEPRATHDVDVVVAIDVGDGGKVVAAFPPPRFYLDAEGAKESVRSGSTFNLVDAADGGHDLLQAPLGAALRRE